MCCVCYLCIIHSAGSIVVLFVLSWSLTLVMLAVVPVVAIGAVVYGRFVQVCGLTSV